MDASRGRDRQHHFAFACLVAIVCLQFLSVCYAQNLGTQPATGQAVQGQTAAQPEGTVLWASLAHIHGIPGMPDWADWFTGELDTHKAIIRALGIGCDPVLVKGQKEQFLDWLSWGVESGAISLPAKTGSIRWPGLSLQDLFSPAS